MGGLAKLKLVFCRVVGIILEKVTVLFMIRKFLQKLRLLAAILADASPGENYDQQNITVVGNNNVVIVNGNSKPNLIIPKHHNNVKHFPSKIEKSS